MLPGAVHKNAWTAPEATSAPPTISPPTPIANGTEREPPSEPRSPIPVALDQA
jgi:hypothetical protein